MKRLLAVLLVVVPLSAQVRETIDVAITNIDVVVTDGKGNRVRGLTRDDFEVLENGQVREITNFTEYSTIAGVVQASGLPSDQARPEAQTTPAAVPPPPRRVMLLFDGKTLTPTIRRNAAQAALGFIDQHVRPNDKVMVAVLSQKFTPRTEWISDRAELKRVVDLIGKETTPGTVQEERKRAEERIEALIELAASAFDPNNSARPPTFGELLTVAKIYAEYALQDTRATAALLGSIATQLGQYPEKKALILIGEGLDARPGWELFQKLETLAQGQVPTPGLELMLRTRKPAENPILEASRYSTTDIFAKLADTSYRAGVPIYALNPGNNQDITEVMEKYGWPPDYRQDFARFTSNFLGYDLVATYSGGAAFVGRKADLALAQVAADLGGYYSIAFRASKAPKDAGSIRVRTRQRHNVRTSLATFIPPEATDAVTDAVLAHHVLDPASNDLEIALETGEIVPAGDKQKVKLSVVIPIRNLQLAQQGSELTGGFDVYLSISDGKSYFSPVNKQSHTIKWPAGSVSEDDERTITYSIDVLLESGAKLISVGVVDHTSKKTGYERIDVSSS
jgi:VWFA-related protein